MTMTQQIQRGIQNEIFKNARLDCMDEREIQLSDELMHLAKHLLSAIIIVHSIALMFGLPESKQNPFQFRYPLYAFCTELALQK